MRRPPGQPRSTAFGTGGLPHCPHGSIVPLASALSAENRTCRRPLLRRLSALCRVVHPVCPRPRPRPSRRERKPFDPPQDRPEKPPRQMTLRQQEPVIPRVLHQPAARLDHPLLQAAHRPRAAIHHHIRRSMPLPCPCRRQSGKELNFVERDLSGVCWWEGDLYQPASRE
jgi:hypothetical protein